MSRRRVEIVGGGLAGLSLGLALCRRGVPVTLHEAGNYPRHRVCGEFIRGLSGETSDRLGVTPVLARAVPQREVAWFARGEIIQRHQLRSPALAISRFELDAELADAFVAAGGDLRLRSRVDPSLEPGRVFATGRRPETRSNWVGLKVHASRLALDRGLEMHLGEHAYVGLTGLPDGRVNVCGLFRRRTETRARGVKLLLAYLHASGLGGLAERLSAAEIHPESFSAVAGLAFSRGMSPLRPALGDTFAMIPPFTGNGMAMAFESAALALPMLQRWAESRAPWDETVERIEAALRRRFATRLRVARLCHPFLLRPTRQRWLARVGRVGALPLNSLQRLLS